MKIQETQLAGVLAVTFDAYADERGSYTRLWGKQDIEELGLDSSLDNIGLSKNTNRGTVRGMHFQAQPFEETKLIQCLKGGIFDVVLDIREGSETFGKHESFELNGTDSKAIYIPKGLAHGFQTLEDETEVLYFISEKWDAASGRGIRWSDPQFGIEFPLEISVINERDANYPDFE